MVQIQTIDSLYFKQAGFKTKKEGLQQIRRFKVRSNRNEERNEFFLRLKQTIRKELKKQNKEIKRLIESSKEMKKLKDQKKQEQLQQIENMDYLIKAINQLKNDKQKKTEQKQQVKELIKKNTDAQAIKLIKKANLSKEQIRNEEIKCNVKTDDMNGIAKKNNKFSDVIFNGTKTIKNFFRQGKTRHSLFKNINIMQIVLKLKYPTADVACVQTMAINYLKNSFLNENETLIGRYINMSFHLKDDQYAWYRSGEIKIESYEQLERSLLTSKGLFIKWAYDQQGYDDSSLKPIDEIIIQISLNLGGALLNYSIKHFEKDTIKDNLVLNNVTNNNCAIACFENIDIINQLNQTCILVKKLVFPELSDDAMIDMNQFNKLCEYYDIGCKVYQIGENDISLILDLSDGYETSINILFHENHFYKIKGSNFINYKKCKVCGYFKVVKSHFKDCKKCKNCGQCYIKEHSEKSCEASQANYSSKINRTVECKFSSDTFTALNNIIYADFETFTKKSKGNPTLKMYAAGYAFNNDPVTVLKGENALDDFIDVLMGVNRQHTLIFYNGSRFDLYFIYKRLIERNIKASQIIAHGAYKYLSFGKIKCFDLNLHIPGSLEDNCEAFGLDANESKTDFDHKKIKSWKGVEKHQNEWMSYLKLDIISLRAIYQKYATSTWETFKINVNKYFTISSLVYRKWQEMNRTDIYLPSFEEDLFIRQSMYGGRTYPQKQYFKSENVENDYLLLLDIVSMYATAMFKYKYPVGKPNEEKNPTRINNVYLKNLNNKSFNYFGVNLFIAQCDIIPNKKLVSAVIPRRDENGLHWDLNNIYNGTYTNIDLERAINHGYTITKIHKVLYWNESSNDVFKNYIQMCFSEKQKATKDTPQYAVAKLFLNTLYGKMLQQPHIIKSKVITTYAELNEIRASENVLFIREMGGEKFVVEYQPDASKLDDEVDKPSQLGCFILSYSRLLMDTYIDAIDGYTNIESTFFRTDTDCLLVHKDQLPKLEPFIGKDLGMLDYEIKGKIVKYAEPAPKTYICEYIRWSDEKTKNHIRAKGFSKKDQKHLTWEIFEAMTLKGKMEDKKIILKDKFKNVKGYIKIKNENIKLKLYNRIKKVALNPTKEQLKNYGISSILSYDFERSLNAAEWAKRVKIPGHKYLASLPIGYEQ